MRLRIGEYVVEVRRGDQPFAHLLSKADLLETFGNLRGRADEDGELLCMGVGKRTPTELVVVQRFESREGGFDSGMLIVPESGTLFLGAGTRLLAYDLNAPERLWEDATKLELAAWTTRGHKLWSAFVEPPWSYTLDGDHIRLDVMGEWSRCPLLTGPGNPAP